MKNVNRVAVATLTGVALLATAACGDDSPTSSGEGGSGRTTISVAEKPTKDRAEDLAYWDEVVAQFTKDHPEITLEERETKYDVQTFQAQLAGGKLPTELVVPFTDPQGLIARKQVADLTEPIKGAGLEQKLNPDTLKVGQSQDGKTYAIPYQAYATGLVYNRALFTEAGLDPDAPPATWDEVRTAAKTIADKTDAAGFEMHTAGNCGGWMFTAMSYSFGGSIENEDGSASTVSSPENAAALDVLRAMRHEDNSMGSNFVVDCAQIDKDFASGKAAMRLGNPDVWNSAVLNLDMKPEDIGVGPMPQGGGGQHGTLAGGTAAIVSPKADDAQKKAAVEWIKAYYLAPYLSEEAAVADAKKRAKAKLPVGLPMISPLSTEAATDYEEWIKPHVNVPVEQFTPYADSEINSMLKPEPPTNGQAVYAAIDPIVQKALTDKDASSADLLSKADKDIQRLLRK